MGCERSGESGRSGGECWLGEAIESSSGSRCPTGVGRGCFSLVKGRGGFPRRSESRKRWFPVGKATQAPGGSGSGSGCPAEGGAGAPVRLTRSSWPGSSASMKRWLTSRLPGRRAARPSKPSELFASLGSFDSAGLAITRPRPLTSASHRTRGRTSVPPCLSRRSRRTVAWSIPVSRRTSLTASFSSRSRSSAVAATAPRPLPIPGIERSATSEKARRSSLASLLLSSVDCQVGEESQLLIVHTP